MPISESQLLRPLRRVKHVQPSERPQAHVLAATNRVLSWLEPTDVAALEPQLKPVFLDRDEVIVEEAGVVGRALFPSDCLLSAMVTLGGKRVETFTIGAEGGFGLLNALGAQVSPDRVIVQVRGWALAAEMDSLRALARERPSLAAILARFAQAAGAQASVNVACNALHDTRQRLCRWLLMTADRIRSPVLPLTQEHLSIMLGVQRTTVTALASDLQAQGVIRYSRGRLTILNRADLEARSCGCYATSLRLDLVGLGADRRVKGADFQTTSRAEENSRP